MCEVAYINETGVGIQIFGDPDVARAFAQNMRVAGFETLEPDDEAARPLHEAS